VLTPERSALRNSWSLSTSPICGRWSSTWLRILLIAFLIAHGVCSRDDLDA